MRSFRKTVRDYDLKRIRAIRKAREVASRHVPRESKLASVRHEVWLESKDGLIAGAIDFVGFTDRGIVIRDYKTGQVFEGQEIKPDYSVQLKLYAALYADSKGEWRQFWRLSRSAAIV